MLQKFFKIENILNNPKLRQRNTTTDKTSTYAKETWTLTKRDRKQLNVFERRVYRRTLGPVYDNEKENWKILTNKKSMRVLKNGLYSSPNIVRVIKSRRMR